MCLGEVTGNPKVVAGLGWKVFKKSTDGKLFPENRGVFQYKYNTWYEAEAFAIKAGIQFIPVLTTEHDRNKEYLNGFHVALRRADARAFAKDHGGVVRQVRYRGAHTTGNGSYYFPGPQVIVAEIKILAPRKGGSAYAKTKKILDSTASVEAAVSAE
jgi:hypothetical protein